MNAKKLCALLLSTVLAVSAMAGCGKSPTGGSTEPAKTAQPKEEKLSGFLVSKDPIEFKIHMHYFDRIVFDDNWLVFKKAAEMTNVKLKGTASAVSANSKETFNMLMASGDIPEIVHYQMSSIAKFGPDGAFIPLNDLIEKNAPNIKAFLEKNPDVKKRMTSNDGNIYSIPFIADGDVAEGWMLRKDWLSKLELKEPKTADEYYNVLKAFREKDPNGNGKKDEVPFFNRDNRAGTRDLLPIFGLPEDWYADKNGKIHNPAYDPEYKNAMQNIQKWYEEGLIDPEIYTRGAKARDILFEGNLGGSTHDWFASTLSYNTKLKDKVPGFNLSVIAPPNEVNGKAFEATSRPKLTSVSSAWAISQKNKKPVETIKYFDFWFTPEGRRLAVFGVENVHYTMVNGKPIFKEEMLKGKEPLLTLLNKDGAGLEIGVQQDFFYEEQGMDEGAKAAVKMYMDKKLPMEALPSLSFTPEEKAVNDAKWTAIQTYIEETRQKWTLGGEPVAAGFDKYIAKLKEMGIEEILKNYQAAYDRLMKSK